ncbi:MAG: NAD(P)H-quinone oxidoreductase, partial [Bacteroidota bacterium]
MKAILMRNFGDPDQLYLGTYDQPQIGPNEALVKVKATALNRADTLQRKGKYPPPAGASPILGLEMAGEVVQIGSEVSRWQKGDRVCALLSGGGYAEYVAVHEALMLPLPVNWNWVEGAAIPEVYLTAFQALNWLAQLQAGERVLIHAGASGVGTAAIQLARAMGAEVGVTASGGKHALCLSLGASYAIDYRQEDFAPAVKKHYEGTGVDVVIDFVAAPYFQQNLEVLRLEGRMVMLAFLGGALAKEVNLAPILRKRLQI